MKKNSKKRVLLSSVAMLMIGAVSLGTATYAWFTTDATPTADGINVKTSKVSTLLLSKSDKSDWKTHIDYGVKNDDDTAKEMFPTSSGDGVNWFAGNAKDGDGTLDTSKDLTDVTGDANYIYTEQLNIWNAGATAMNGVKITFSLAGTNSQYARVALVPADADGKALTTVAYTGQKIGFTNCIFAKADENVNYKPIISTKGTEGAEIKPSTTYEVLVGDMDMDAYAYYNLYVWFEGQDKDCKDALSGQGIPALSFQVEGTAAEE